ncbi:MAG: hypothetical protein WB973_10830 [Thermoanaerobaculia bacterium]
MTAVLRRIESRMPYPDSLQGLSRVEADLMAAVTAHGVIGNGGHDFWYQGRNREHTLRAADAFERMGEGNAADAMRRSLEAFPAGRPTEDYVFAHRAELKDLFSPLDEIIWDVDFDAVAARYIRAKKAELSAADPDLMKAVPALWAH